MKEEPSYMMFARTNVRESHMTPPAVVRALLERIDRLEREKEEKTAPKGYRRGENVWHTAKGRGQVYQDQGASVYVYVVFDDQPGICVSVDPNELRKI